MHHVASFEPERAASCFDSDIQLHKTPFDHPSSPNAVVSSITGIVHSFVHLSVQEISALPTFYFAQLIHASIALAKLYFVAQAVPEVSRDLALNTSYL